MNGAVITALNEAETIGALVAELKAQGLEVLVIDDGSTDETKNEALINGAYVIRHKSPQGIRKSLIQAWEIALDCGWDYTAQIDAGGSHNPSDWTAIKLHEHRDLFIGSRFRPASKYIGRRWRATASRIVAVLLNFITHKKITDWTSGYRVFSRKALEVLKAQNYLATGHAWQIEVIQSALENNLTVAEFPITYRAGSSSLKIKTIDELLKVMLWVLNR